MQETGLKCRKSTDKWQNCGIRSDKVKKVSVKGVTIFRVSILEMWWQFYKVRFILIFLFFFILFLAVFVMFSCYCKEFISTTFMLVMGHSTIRCDIYIITLPLFLDIDECAAQVKPCDVVANSECKNTEGSYHCQCKDGFVNNGVNCEGATHFLLFVSISSILN